jgi:phosphoserine phosphatase RsbU/P
VGGDFFQQIADRRGGMLVAVGDVSGNGLPAAMIVSVLAGAIRAEASRGATPADLLKSVNDRLVGRPHGGFLTCPAASISADGLLTLANAGHLPPYLNGKDVYVPASLRLGILEQPEFAPISVQLEPGDRLTFLV